MKISVIIACYNAQDFIGEQMEALARQEYAGEWEVIVSDNGSKDGSVEVVERYRRYLPNLIIVDSGDKKGAAHARNLGVMAASGDVLLFCDADDVVSSGWLSAMAKALHKHDFVAGAFEGEKLNSGLRSKGRSIKQTRSLQEYNYPDFLPHAGGGNLGVRRYVHERVGGFDETMPRLMDTDYCWRIQLAGFGLHFVPDAVLHMRLRNTLVGSLKQAHLWGRYNVSIYKKYRPHGMPPLKLERAIRGWVQLIKALPLIRSRLQFDKWLRQFAWRLGRLEGCLRYRVMAF